MYTFFEYPLTSGELQFDANPAMWSDVLTSLWLGVIGPHLGIPAPDVLSALGVSSVVELWRAATTWRGPRWYHGTTEAAARAIQQEGFVINRRHFAHAVFFGSPVTASWYGEYLIEAELQCDILPFCMRELEDARKKHPTAEAQRRLLALAGIKATYLTSLTGLEVLVNDPSVIQIRRCIPTADYWRERLDD